MSGNSGCDVTSSSSSLLSSLSCQDNFFNRAVSNVTSGSETVESSRYLLEFLATRECWTSAIELAMSPEPYASFFAANMLYSKCLKYFDQFDESERIQCIKFLLQSVSSKIFHRSTLERLCLCICALSCHVEGGVGHLVESALSMISQQDSSELHILGGSILLSSLPGEISCANLSIASKSALDSVVSVNTCQVIDAMIDLAKRRHVEYFDISCKCFCSWLAFGPSVEVVSPIFMKILEFVSSGINSRDDDKVIASCHVIESFFSYVPNDKGQTCMDLYNITVQQLLSLWSGVLQFYFLTSDGRARCISDELAHATMSAVVAIIDFSIEDVCCSGVYTVELFTILLTCFECPFRRISAIAFDILEQIADFELEDRHQYLKKDVFSRTIAGILNLCIMPIDQDGDDYEEVLEFREIDRGVGDAINTACDHLLMDRDLVPLLTAALQSVDLSMGGGAENSFATELAKLEAILFIFCAAMPSIKSFVERCVAGGNVESANEIFVLMSQLNEFLNSNKASFVENPKLLQTACQWVRPFLVYFNGNRFPSLLPCIDLTVELLIFALTLEGSNVEASRCLKSASLHFTSVVPVVISAESGDSGLSLHRLLSTYCDYVFNIKDGISPPPVECSLHLLDAMFNLIPFFDDTMFSQILGRFAEMISFAIISCSDLDSAVFMKASRVLLYVLEIMSSFVQNCSVMARIPADFHAFIAELFPQFLNIFPSIYSHAPPQLMSKLFRFYSSVISHFGETCLVSIGSLIPIFGTIFGDADSSVICSESLDTLADLLDLFHTQGVGLNETSRASLSDLIASASSAVVMVVGMGTGGPVVSSFLSCASIACQHLPEVLNRPIMEATVSVLTTAIMIAVEDRDGDDKVVRDATSFIRTSLSSATEYPAVLFSKYFDVLKALFSVCLRSDEGTSCNCIPGAVQAMFDLARRFRSELEAVVGGGGGGGGLGSFEEHQRWLAAAVSSILRELSHQSEKLQAFASSASDGSLVADGLANMYVVVILGNSDSIFRLFMQDLIGFGSKEGCGIEKFGDYLS